MRNDRFQSRERGNVAYYHLPGLLNFMNCTDFFCRCFIHTGSISMTGVRLVPFMEPRKTACGAEDVWKQEKLSRKKCLHLCRSTGFLPV